jgi:hypothetical protein
MPLTTMRRRILRSLLYRLGPFGVAALLFALASAPSALAWPDPIQNPGFETGTWAPYWAGSGSFGAYADITPYNTHSGSYAAVIGYPYRPSNIRTEISQYVYVPTGDPIFQPTLRFWIRPQCGSSADSFKVFIRDRFIPSFFKVVLSECTTSTAWVQRTVNINEFAGRYVELSFDVWSFGSGSPTYVLLDDVSL